jgi:hypothetical protein
MRRYSPDLGITLLATVAVVARSAMTALSTQAQEQPYFHCSERCNGVVGMLASSR